MTCSSVKRFRFIPWSLQWARAYFKMDYFNGRGHHAQLKKHLADFIDAYNFGRRLKTLKGLTPYEFIRKQWTLEPDRFIIGPIHQMPGLNTFRAFAATTALARMSAIASCEVLRLRLMRIVAGA